MRSDGGGGRKVTGCVLIASSGRQDATRTGSFAKN